MSPKSTPLAMSFILSKISFSAAAASSAPARPNLATASAASSNVLPATGRARSSMYGNLDACLARRAITPPLVTLSNTWLTPAARPRRPVPGTNNPIRPSRPTSCNASLPAACIVPDLPTASTASSSIPDLCPACASVTPDLLAPCLRMSS